MANKEPSVMTPIQMIRVYQNECCIKIFITNKLIFSSLNSVLVFYLYINDSPIKINMKTSKYKNSI